MRVIAIDGPAGAGKSTIAKQVALATGLQYLDTGAMYRCIALAVQRRSIDIANSSQVGEIAGSAHIEIEGDTARLDNEDVSSFIRTAEISNIVSVIAAHPPVRDAMRSQQRAWAINHGGGVVEGRDIGSVVFPDATIKIFLTATAEVRALRRVAQVGGDVKEIAANILERDHIDSTRADSPLLASADSILVDSSNRAVSEIVSEIVEHFTNKIIELSHG